MEVVSKSKVALRLLRRSDHCVKRAAEGLQRTSLVYGTDHPLGTSAGPHQHFGVA